MDFLKQQINQLPNLVAVGKVRRNRVVSASIDLAVDLCEVSARERQFKRTKLIKNAPKSPQVTPGVVRLTIPYFGSDVVDCSAAAGLRLDIVSRTEVSCQAEVADLYLVSIEKDILRLEVVVDNIYAVQIGEC